MKGEDYNIALFMFFIPYILLEVPSNMILKKLRPSVWISAIMFCWGMLPPSLWHGGDLTLLLGVITICQGVTQSFAGLVVCRVLLGVFEAGFFPGMPPNPPTGRSLIVCRLHLPTLNVLPALRATVTCQPLLLSKYPSRSFQWRKLGIPHAGFVSDNEQLLAYAIAHMSGIAGYGGWRWIFILEGLFTCVVAFISFWLIPDWPESARFLTMEERELLIHRLAVDAADAKMSRWDKKAAKRVFSDPKIYLG
jgi:MFS family permease